MFTNCAYDQAGCIVCNYRGMPFQCTEKETPVEWLALKAAIEAGDVVVGEYKPVPVVPPTEVEILAANTETFLALKGQASMAMTPLLLSLQLGDATAAETASARLWQSYSRALLAVDLTKAEPLWPALPS